MKIVQINTTCGIGSTGKICVGISQLLSEKNIENYIIYSSRSNGYDLGIACTNDLYIKLQALKSRLLGNYGFNSVKETKRIIRELDRINPDIVHLHNIHGHDCNLELLFTYFKKHNIKLIWTFHDCWVFTGYCVYYDILGCEKWKKQCENCGQKNSFSVIFDRSKQLFLKKKSLFKDLDLTIVTPSKWLANEVKQSFMKDYPVKVIYNGIDLSIFQPSESSVREKYDIPVSKKIVLGVAFEWGERKGFDVFIELAKRLDFETYQIVLVGTNESLDKHLPEHIISIHRTQNQEELSQLYAAADVFVNPTREEVLGLTNIEANACGTPVITFQTGGSPECIDCSSGIVVEKEDMDALTNAIIQICENKPYSLEACQNNAKRFDANERYEEYIKLYETIDIE